MNETNHGIKKIAPIVITVVLIAYFIAYFGILLSVLPGPLKVIFAVVPLALAATSIYVCKERIKEIDGGEEDDLSQY